mmetsp:Transcript_7878/g.35756  ORF Transcript_7878/g.35756 Transcript_7878/m.35756 type:complete len:323 (+) Transcript_7878:293-1261(+)
MYVVTAQWKFAKSGVSGYQLLTSQHGNLSNPDLINVTAHTWTGTGVDYSRPFVIGTQSKGNRRAGRYLEGYVAEFRYYFQVLDQDELTAIQDELLYKYGASCDASAPPANGEVGDCTNELISGTTCQPTCDVGYAASGPSTCKDGVLSPAVCIGVLHLVADDITDVDAGNLVQSWSDHTGNGLSLSSFVAAPELVDGGNISTGALFNGHKAVRFGESGITGLSLPTSALQLSTSLEGMTVVAVMSTDDSRDATAPFLFDRGSVSGEGFGFHISPAKVKIYSAENHGGKSRTNSAPPIMKTGRCTSSPLSGSSRKAASADTNS